MKLREIIKDITEEDWLEIIERTKLNRRSCIGRAPKKYIVGEVLDYEALYIGEGRKNRNYRTHCFLVENNLDEAQK